MRSASCSRSRSSAPGCGSPPPWPACARTRIACCPAGAAAPRSNSTGTAGDLAENHGNRPPLNLTLPFAIRGSRPRLFGGGPRRGVASGPNINSISELAMSTTFDTIANIIAETCDIPRDSIKPESHAINDLGIDSLDFLDIAFAIDKAFGIKMPLEQWTQEVNEGKATTEQYFVLKNLSDRVDELVAAKGA